MTISRAILLAVLRQAMPGVEEGNALLEGADTFIFEGGKVYTYNNNISVQIPIPDEILEGNSMVGALKAAELYAVLQKFPADEIQLEITPKLWTFTAGKVKAKLSRLVAGIQSKATAMAANVDFQEIPQGFVDGLKFCYFNSNKTPLSGVVVSGNTVLSTDSNRMNFFEMQGDMGTFWIQDAAAKNLIALPVTSFAVDNEWVHFRSDDGAVFSAKALAVTQFPVEKMFKVRATMQKQEGDFAAWLPPTLVAAVDRASSMSMSVEQHEAVEITFTNDGISILGSRSTGDYQETIEWPEPLAAPLTEPVTVYVDGATISYALRRASDFWVRVMEVKGAIQKRLAFAGENCLHIASTYRKDD